MDTGDFDERVNGIIRDSNRELNQIKRSGATLRLFALPPISLFLALLAWYGFTHGNISVGIVNACGSLAFLLMLALGPVFDRPVPEDRDTLPE